MTLEHSAGQTINDRKVVYMKDTTLPGDRCQDSQVVCLEALHVPVCLMADFTMGLSAKTANPGCNLIRKPSSASFALL
jgi:hypothetical protein